jgi:31-O-methyltransferase
MQGQSKALRPQELSKAAIESICRRYFRDWESVSKAYFDNILPNPLVLRQGLIIEHDARDRIPNLFYDIFIQNCYTRQNFYIPKPTDTVLDVGANIGVFAIYLTWRAPGIKVHCFEPSTDARSRLIQNVRHNRLEGMVHAHAYAIFNARCRRALWNGPSTSLNSFFCPSSLSADPSCEEVECIPLTAALDYTQAETIDLVKIDVEGSELEILEGVTTNEWRRIRKLAIEFHEDLRPGVLGKLKDILNANGFDVDVDIGPPFSSTAGIVKGSRGH